MEYSAWIGLWTFIGMFVFLMLGVPIFICLFAAAFVGSLLIGGPIYTLHQFASGPYHITSSYTFAVVPLFVLMSTLAVNCGIAQNAYDAARKWLGGFRGGLLMVTVGAAGIFGAACGSSIATSAVFAKMALPELKKYKYDRSLSMGCIAAGGTLDALVPPNVGTVIVCILVEASIGKALVGGVIPGIIYALFLIMTIQVIGYFRPTAVPKLDIAIPWKEKFSSLALILPVLFIVLLIIGGMYLGVFPPTVAGAIGSVGVLIIAFIRRVGIKAIGDAFYEAILLNAQLFPLIISGFLFARFMAISGLPKMLLQVVIDAHLPPLMVMLSVIIFYLFIGCVLEFMSMAVVTLPIVYPLLLGVGFDPIASVIIIVFLSEVALLTPPIGMSAFMVAGVAGVSPEVVFRGILPYFIVCLVLLWLMVFFPQIVTWLPNLFYGRLAG
jgi:tripartite ATP-independent transporter DctM subunit